MKAIWLLGLLVVLLTVAYDKVAGNAADTAQRGDAPVVVPVAAGIEARALPPGRLDEYTLLHRTRGEAFPLNAIAVASFCPE